MRVKSADHAEVSTARANPNKGTERGSALVRQSIADYGFGRPILLDANHVAIAGNHTLEAAVELGLPIILVETYGDEVIAHVRKDLILDSESDSRARELAVMDNRSTLEGVEWDIAILQSMVDNGDNLLSSFWPEELDELGVIMDRPKLTGVNSADDAFSSGRSGNPNTTPLGTVFRLGNHVLTTGIPTKFGDIEVMIAAWEAFTGEKAEMGDGASDFNEFDDYDPGELPL